MGFFELLHDGLYRRRGIDYYNTFADNLQPRVPTVKSAHEGHHFPLVLHGDVTARTKSLPTKREFQNYPETGMMKGI